LVLWFFGLLCFGVVFLVFVVRHLGKFNPLQPPRSLLIPESALAWPLGGDSFTLISRLRLSRPLPTAAAFWVCSWFTYPHVASSVFLVGFGV